jgi:hypothetical protein
MPSKIKRIIFWNVNSCNLADHYWCFGGTSLSIFRVKTVNSEQGSPETLATIYQIILSYRPRQSSGG